MGLIALGTSRHIGTLTTWAKYTLFKTMKNDIQPTNPFATIISVLGIFALSLVTAVSQVTPGGTVGDTAIYLEVEGGEQLTRATAAGAYGPTLVHDFDTEQLADATYQLNPSGANATEIAVSAGRHLMLYNTRFIATAFFRIMTSGSIDKKISGKVFSINLS